MANARALLAGAALLACAVAATFFYGYVRQNQVDVYFDNGLEVPVRVSFADDAFNLAPQQAMKRTYAPGAYQAVVSSHEGAVEVERVDVVIEKRDLMSALIHPQFYVYNVAQVHIYRRASHVYAANENQREYTEQLFSFQHFFSQPKAHFVFQPAPDTVTTDSSTAHREEFDVARDIDYNTIATTRFNDGNMAGAAQALEKALQIDPCHVSAYRNHVAMLDIQDLDDEATETARSWISICADGGIENHRGYQDTMNDLGRGVEVLAEYRKHRRMEPTAENDYLYGRLLSGAEAVALHRAALAKDPNLSRARLALGYELLGLEKYAAAFTELAPVIDSPAYALEAVPMYALAGIATGKVEETGATLTSLGPRFPDDGSVWEARWILALAESDWDSAERLHQEYRRVWADEGWAYRTKLHRVQGQDDLVEQYLVLGSRNAELASEVTDIRFERHFERGDYPSAIQALDAFEDGGPGLYRLYAAAGLTMTGERARARAMLAELEDELGPEAEYDFLRSMMRTLTGGISEEESLKSARETSFLMLPHAYFMLGAHHLSQGRERQAMRYFAKAESTSLYLDFPYLAAKHLTEP